MAVLLTSSACWVGCSARPARAESPVGVDEHGTINIRSLTVPLSSYLSPPARAGTAKYFQFLSSPAAAMFSLDESMPIAERRRAHARNYEPVLERTRALYAVESVAQTLAGVPVDVFTPKAGVAAKNEKRVLINLHGGGFMMGARYFGALESMPVAALGGIKVIAVDYRQGPEHQYPAASEDVAAVYRELLKEYVPESIGIYGCSAGGFLTAQATAWILDQKLPPPGAIGIFCASAGGWTGGDSLHLARPLIGMTPMDSSTLRNPTVSDVAYLRDADFKDPRVAPIVSPTMLARFPPTLVLTSTRDSAMSAAVHTHAQLIKAGVEADLHVWEGLPHGFFTFEPDFPESAEAWTIAVKFFDRHLGASR